MAGNTRGKNRAEAVAYLRTSSAANVGSDKDSEKRQRAAVTAFAKREGFEIVDEFYDAAVSGADAIESRAGFAALLDRIEGNGVRTVIVEDASRFARELMAQELGVSLLIARGVRLLTASGDDLTASDDPTRKMMRQIAGAFAEYEKSRLVGKLRHARERVRQAKGVCEGRKPRAEQLRARLMAGAKPGSTPEQIEAWQHSVRDSLPLHLAKQLPADFSKGVEAHLGNRIADELAEHVEKAIAEAKRLHRASPKTGERRSLRKISAELDRLGYRNERGEPYSAKSVRAMLRQ